MLKRKATKHLEASPIQIQHAVQNFLDCLISWLPDWVNLHEVVQCLLMLGDSRKLSIVFIIDSFGKSIAGFDGIIDSFYIFKDVLLYNQWKSRRIALSLLISVTQSEIWKLRMKLNLYVLFGFPQIFIILFSNSLKISVKNSWN